MTLALQVTRWLLVTALIAVFAAPFAWGLITGDSFMKVTGGSMRPTYEVGDVLLVQRPTGNELTTVGEPVVVTLTPGDTATQYVHRVHSLVDGGAILKGDNNEIADPGFVTDAHVVGAPRFALTGTAAWVYDVTQWWVTRAFGIAVVLVLLLVSPRKAATKSREDGDESSVVSAQQTDADGLQILAGANG